MKTIYCLFLLTFFTLSGFAQEVIVKTDTIYVLQQPVEQIQPQESKESPQKTNTKNDKVYYGGYANFSIGKYSIIGFEPLIGYKLSPKLSIGGKVSYEYFKNKNYSPTREGSNYGIGAFSRLRIARRFYAHVEFSEMNYRIYKSLEDSKRQWISFLYVGGGFSLPISKTISLNAEVLWDVLQDNASPYKTVEPIFNLGIGVGF